MRPAISSLSCRYPFLLAYLVVLLLCCFAPSSARTSRPKQNLRDFHTLSSAHLEAIARLEPKEWQRVDEGHLGKLLIPRASGSVNNTLVQKYISSVFKKLNWHEEATSFTDSTPIGNVEFTNLAYTFDPTAPRRVILAAHFDSKWFPDFPQNQFLGATDSAAPCAMLLDLAEAITPLLEARRSRVSSGAGLLSDGFDEEESAETTLTLLFLDGEEAFHDWTATDSIYGARYLAQHWEDTYPPNNLQTRRYDPIPTYLDSIDHFVLLDLLGNSHSRIHSYYRETDWLHGQMADADKRLRAAGLVEVEQGEEAWFQMQKMPPGMIGDDHVPFVERGVSILHVISNPFPRVWHTLADDASALSLPAMRRWNRILRVFTAEYLGLSLEGLKRTIEKDDTKRIDNELVGGTARHG